MWRLPPGGTEASRTLLEDALVGKLLILSPTADALGKHDYRLHLTHGLAPNTARLVLLSGDAFGCWFSPLRNVFTPRRTLKSRS